MAETSVKFPSIGHFQPETTNLENWKKNHEWFLQEKADGSNLWFHINRASQTRDIVFGNKTKVVKENPVWKKTIHGIRQLDMQIPLNDNYDYFGESITKRDHGKIMYDTTPPYWFILFDIFDHTTGKYLHYEDVQKEANRLGIMMAKVIYDNAKTNDDRSVVDIVKDTIDRIESGEIQSCLGGCVEGVVIKHPAFTVDGEISYRRQKCVTSAFKEMKATKFVKYSDFNDSLTAIGDKFATEARWHKAYMRAKENGKLTKNINKCIKYLIDDLDADLVKERVEMIKDDIFDLFKDDLEKARENGEVCFHSIKIADDRYMREMLYIEFSDRVFKASREGFSKWVQEVAS